MSQKPSTPKATSAFLDSFNAVDLRLRRLTKRDRFVPFTRVLEQAVKQDASIGPMSYQIELYNQLRNVIVHNGTDLAEPLKRALDGIERIRHALEAPPTLGPMFHERPVTTKPDAAIRTVVDLMATKDFSQLPVYDRRGLIQGVVTTAAIARWLGKHSEGAGVDLSAAVSEVMRNDEYPDAWRVFKATDTVGKALAAFKEEMDQGRPLYAILLTEGAKHDSSPVGIITLFDVPKLWHAAIGSQP